MRVASPQAYLLTWFLKWRVKRPGAGPRDVQAARRLLNRAPPFDGRDVTIAAAEVGGVPGEWVTSSAGKHEDGPVLLFLHGGGYFACSPRTHRSITCALARTGLLVFAPDYRLAPEHPFPAAVEDATAAYRGLLKRAAPGRIVVAGDSAGGGLAAALLVALKQAGLPMPAGAALFSPWTDLAGTGASLKANAKRDAMFTGEGIEELAKLYLQGADPREPTASPLYADWSGMPPLLIHVGSSEVLFDDSVRLAARARAAGVPVELRSWPVVPHIFPLMHKALPEGRTSMREVAAFLHARTAEGVAGGAGVAQPVG